MTAFTWIISSARLLILICCIATDQGLPVTVTGQLLGFSMFVSLILSKIRAYNLYRQTVCELTQLSDRELADLGVARFDIARVAREGAFA
jgi:uncharacterized protein YjiS (DUF1127 family)